MPNENPITQPPIGNEAVVVPPEVLPVNNYEQEAVNIPESGPEVTPAATAESATVGAEIASGTGSLVQDDNAVQGSVPADDQGAVAQADGVTSSDAATANTTVFDDTTAFPGDDVYVREVNRVIEQDKDKPYQEEEDSETIQKDYLAKRFGVNADMDKE